MPVIVSFINRTYIFDAMYLVSIFQLYNMLERDRKGGEGKDVCIAMVNEALTLILIFVPEDNALWSISTQRQPP